MASFINRQQAQCRPVACEYRYGRISVLGASVQFKLCMANQKITLPDGGVTVPADVAVLVLFGLSDRSGDFPLDIN
jgi:hypothetical protein